MFENSDIYILNTLMAGIETTDILMKYVKIKGVIGLKNNYINQDSVSGYCDVEDYCHQNKLDYFGLESYSMSSESDKAMLLSLKIDLLLVLGWQRLIPNWFIKSIKFGVVGAHGSPWGIEKGRGRSPLNWSLIFGCKKFTLSIFKINEGIDEGGIVDTTTFDISEFDDINSGYLKISWAIAHLMIKNIKNNRIYKELPQQNTIEPRYLPKRVPEDGKIDWHQDESTVYNHIRALTKPYPGAYAKIDQKKIKIWKAIPMGYLIGDERYEPGQIMRINKIDHSLIIKCGNGSILVTEYELDSQIELSEGLILKSSNHKEQLLEILQRHYKDYPDLKCNEIFETIYSEGII